MTDLPTAGVLLEQLGQSENLIETLEESLAAAQLALEDRGWTAFTDATAGELTVDGRRRACQVARALAVTHPLIRRGLALRTAYVWGQGVQITGPTEEDGAQDVNAVVQAFLDDPGNRAAFTSGQAHEENERALGTDGNLFLALFTNPRTGRVQVRVIPADQVAEIITNPDDSDDPWFYRRTWTAKTVASVVDAAGAAATRTTTEQRTVFYPALGYRPRRRPRTIDEHPVQWDAPVRHVSVNRLNDWLFGVGDVYSAMSWARMYSDFLTDWARLMKALSKLAWQAQTPTKAGGAQVRERLAVGALSGDAGGTAVGTVRMEAVSKSGATLDSESGKPLAAMVGAALDLPVTMLLTDPGVTGARATAETLDKPMALAMGMRRGLWSDVERDVVGYVIDQAVKAPAGPLRGTVRVDPDSGREVIALAGDQDRTVDVAWPPLDEADPKVLVDAIVAADSTGKLPPLEVATLLLHALGVEDVDSVLEQLVDEDGTWVDPLAAAAAAREQAVVGRSMQPDPAAVPAVPEETA